MSEHRTTTLQVLDVIENEIHDYNYSIFGILRSIILTIPNLFNMIYPADGVDNIKQTINGNHEAFHSAYGNYFRMDSLTKFSSFLGLPNRQLHKDSYQSVRNLLQNFSGGLDAKSDKTSAIIILLNTFITPLKFLLNIAKLITEFVPALLFVTVILTMAKIFKNLEFPTDNFLRLLGIGPTSYLNKNTLAGLGVVLFSPLIIASASLYLAGCCLTSSYETMRSAWHFGGTVLGKEFGTKILGFVFIGIIIATTIVVNIFALPWAAKFLVAYVLPRITPFLPQAIVNVIDKIGAVIKPVLTIIGNTLAPILKYAQVILPEFVGAGLFGTIIRSLVSPIVDYGVDKIQAWWNYNPEFDEKSEIDILSQQSKMLCDLGAIQEEQPSFELHEAPNIINGYISPEAANNINGDAPRVVESQLNRVTDNPSQPLLVPGLNNSIKPVNDSQRENGIEAEQSLAEKYKLTLPSSAPSSVLFPPENFLKPSEALDRNTIEKISRTPSPSAQ